MTAKKIITGTADFEDERTVYVKLTNDERLEGTRSGTSMHPF